MDNNNSHVEETQDFYHEEHHNCYTEGRERGKWVVKVIDSKGSVTEEHLTAHDIGEMGWVGRRVILEFGPNNQPEGGSGGIFGTWLGQFSPVFYLYNLDSNYEDWRKVPKDLKDEAWDTIQRYFYFDASNEKYKKFVMKSMGQKCKAYKIRLWKRYRRETFEETIANPPGYISKERWHDFVHLQFNEKTKKLRERNMKNRSHYKTPHTLGKKSIARKSKEMFLETGKRPNRAEIFVRTRQKSDKSFVNEEARALSEKLKEKITQNTGNTSENDTTSDTNDIFFQVFGAERHGRVRCVGLGPTPSTFFQNSTTSTSTETELIDSRNRVNYLEKKLNELEDKFVALAASIKGTHG